MTPLVSAGPASCCSGPPSGGFSYSGAATLTVHSGYAFGLIATGSNGDSNHTLSGDITLTNFQGPSDVTPPVITPTVTGTLGTNGWYTSDVAVSWTVTDDGSTISSTSGCGPTTISTDTASMTLTCTATSAGGTDSQSVTIKRDATAPALAPTVTPNPVVLNGTVTATANATDAGSGVASQGCASVITSSVGAQSVACTATDNAGNSATANASYTVIYNVCALYDQTKAHKIGSTIPVKLQLCDANGVNQSAAGIVVNATGLTKMDSTATAVVDDSGAANSPDNNFRYDATLGGTGGYIFNLSMKGLTLGTWKLGFTAGGATYALTFDVR